MDAIAGTAFGLVVNSQKDLSEPFVTNAKKIMTGGGRLTILGAILSESNIFEVVCQLVWKSHFKVPSWLVLHK